MSAFNLSFQISQQYEHQQQQESKPHFKSAWLRLQSTSCKAFKANQVSRWRAMLGSKICLTWRATPFSNDSQFQDIFFSSQISRQTAGPWQSLSEALRPHKWWYSCVRGTKATGLHPSVKNPTRLSDCPALGKSIRILLRSLAAESVLQLQHHDSWDSSQTPHVTTAQWCKQPTHYYNCGMRQIHTEMVNCLL